MMSDSSSDRLFLAVLAALVLHALLIFGIRFQLPRPAPVKRNLDIELVQQPSRERPDQADYRAAHDSQGGASRRERPRPVAKAPPAGQPRSRPVRPRSRDKKPVLTAAEADTAVVSGSKQVPSQPRLNPGLLARQIAELGKVSKRPLLFASERVTPIHRIRAHKYIAAAYEKAWQDKVERVGNLNYPDEARRKGMSGRLLMSVWVAKDGRVRKIKIHRSSGHKVLDAAAIRIVRLAAPFSPFPKELAAQTDVLVITRTWNFLSEAGLAMGH
ncbi:MAG TPA: energy transducer TonB [Methylothermaceae bacterium]|nr:energy transducer TonB [Methylothermaceae bacterium]